MTEKLTKFLDPVKISGLSDFIPSSFDPVVPFSTTSPFGSLLTPAKSADLEIELAGRPGDLDGLRVFNSATRVAKAL